MNIALVIERLEVGRGGRERSVAEIAAALAGRGHAVTVICQRGQRPPAGVELLEMGSRGLGRAAQLRNFAVAVERAVRRHRCDVVHATLPIPAANVYQPRGGTAPGRLAARRQLLAPARRLASRLAGPLNLARRAYADLERQVLADHRIACLCVSGVVAEELAVYYGRRENVRVVYSGVDVPDASAQQRQAWRRQWRQRWGASDAETLLLCPAHNFAVKGVAPLIEALARGTGVSPRSTGVSSVCITGVPPVDCRLGLVVVGNDVAWPYRRLARRLGVGSRVTFEKGVDDIFPLYSAADAVALLSWQDACSRVVLEAMRWGVPSLTTRQNGAHELLVGNVVTHDVTAAPAPGGLVVESPDDAAVPAALAELCDPARRAALAEGCRQRSALASMKRQVDELCRAYELVAAGRGVG